MDCAARVCLCPLDFNVPSTAQGHFRNWGRTRRSDFFHTITGSKDKSPNHNQQVGNSSGPAYVKSKIVTSTCISRFTFHSITTNESSYSPRRCSEAMCAIRIQMRWENWLYHKYMSDLLFWHTTNHTFWSTFICAHHGNLHQSVVTSSVTGFIPRVSMGNCNGRN